MVQSPRYPTSSNALQGRQSPRYPTSSNALQGRQSPRYPSSTEEIPSNVQSSRYPSSTYTFQGRQSPRYPSLTNYKLGGIDGLQFEQRTIPADRLILNSLTRLEIADDAVETSEIANASVTPAKLDRTYQTPLVTLSFEAGEFRDIAGTTPTTSVEVNDEDAVSLPDGVTTGFRVAFEIPSNYDGVGNIEVYLRISASTSFAGNFSANVDHRRNGGALVGVSIGLVTPSVTANVQTQSGLVLSLTPAGIAAGDGVTLLITRNGGGGPDSHTGAMRVFSVIVKVPV